MKTRKAGMDYGTYKAMCSAKKEAPISEDEFKALPVDGGDNEPDGDEPENEDEPADGGDGGGAEPSEDEDPTAEKGMGLGDLRKSLRAFNAVDSAARVAVGGSRETYLKARLDASTITKSERAELGRLWSGVDKDQPADAAGRPLRKSLTEYLDPEDQQVVNAAPLLKSLIGGLQDRLDTIANRSEVGTESLRQLVIAEGQLVKSLCGAVLEMGDQLTRRDHVIKALETRLGIVETTPAAPRAVRAGGTAGAPGRPLAKSVQGGGGARPEPGAGGTDLKKSVVVRAFHTLVKAAGDGNDYGTANRLTEECAAFERGGRLAPGTRAAIEAIAST
jgi:hypothetical protein